MGNWEGGRLGDGGREGDVEDWETWESGKLGNGGLRRARGEGLGAMGAEDWETSEEREIGRQRKRGKQIGRAHV